MRPAIGLTAGAGVEDANLANTSRGPTTVPAPHADDRNPSFEQRASSCMTLLHMAVMGAATWDPPGHRRLPQLSVSSISGYRTSSL